MTIDEFQSTTFSGGMRIKYSGQVYDVVSVDFLEKLFGFILEGGDLNNLSWARCENVEFI